MHPVELRNNEFLRQFETLINGSLARIEYAEQERKIFLTKLVIPVEVNDAEFEENFIKSVLEFISEKKLRVVPTSPKIAGFVRKNKSYKSLLPVGIKL
ncbi:MAG: N-acetyltransferase [Flavobacteriaceae bacterium]|nr:N-acetyltransferase [Flavobacteriaceae bacterium]|tara:strand:+ start:1620 stop:1913 length:294 start_codon:yes stop_codon:yes gene_type:complete